LLSDAVSTAVAECHGRIIKYNELEDSGMEVVVIYFKVIFCTSLKELKKSSKNLSGYPVSLPRFCSGSSCTQLGSLLC